MTENLHPVQKFKTMYVTMFKNLKIIKFKIKKIKIMYVTTFETHVPK